MKSIVLVAVMMSAAVAEAEWNFNLASGWRVLGGANYNSGVKANLGINGANAARFLPSAIRPGGNTSVQAEAASKALTTSGARVDFPIIRMSAWASTSWPDSLIAISRSTARMSAGRLNVLAGRSASMPASNSETRRPRSGQCSSAHRRR